VQSNRLANRTGAVAIGLAAAATAIAGVITGLGVPASVAGSPTPPLSPVHRVGPEFPAAADLPQGARYGSWRAAPIRRGIPAAAPFCLDGGVLDPARTSFRSYSADPGTAAEEFITVPAGEAEATTLVGRLGSRLESCYRRWLDAGVPARGRRAADWARYVEAGSGAPTIYGVFTRPPGGLDPRTDLYAVGRRGSTVMVLHLSLVCERISAPVAEFSRVAATALRAVG